MSPLKFLEYIVILCFERGYTKQNTVFRLKSNILPPPVFVLATLLTMNLVSVDPFHVSGYTAFTQKRIQCKNPASSLINNVTFRKKLKRSDLPLKFCTTSSYLGS